MYHLTKKGKSIFLIDYYRGQIIKNQRQGFGLQLFLNGCFYIGLWEKNKAHGYGKLVYPDGTYYQGEFKQGSIISGEVKYSNGAKFDGFFDGSPLERFQNGTFYFTNNFKFTGEWKDGFIVKGTLYYKNFEIENFQNSVQIQREIKGSGVLLSQNNKWMYEGGFKNKKFDGDGMIYCSFQQYKKACYKEDTLINECYKMSVNWGEITNGQYLDNEKIGQWTRITNNGYCLYNGGEVDKVTFPFINDDYFVGKFRYIKQEYSIHFISGMYFTIDKGQILDKKIIKNQKNLPFSKINFDYTYKKIFLNQNLQNEFQKGVNWLSSLVNINFNQLPSPFEAFQQQQNPKQSLKQKPKFTLTVDNVNSFQNEIKQAYFDLKKQRSPIAKKRVTSPFLIKSKIPIKDNQNQLLDKLEKIHQHKQNKGRYNLNENSKSVLLDKEDIKLFDKITESNTQTEIQSVPRKSYKYSSVAMSPSEDLSLLQTLSTKKDHTQSIFDNDENISIFDLNSDNKNKIYTPQLVAEIVQLDMNMEEEIQTFEGTLIKQQKQGLCRIVYKSGLFVEANFKQGILEGEGMLIFPNGIEHYGQFKKGLLEGAGSVTIGNEVFKGKFFKGNFSNERVYSTDSNVHFVFDQKIDKGEYMGQVVIYLPNGYQILDCKIEKEIVQSSQCRIKDDLNQIQHGKIKFITNKQYYIFQTKGVEKKHIINLIEGTIKLKQQHLTYQQ